MTTAPPNSPDAHGLTPGEQMHAALLTRYIVARRSIRDESYAECHAIFLATTDEQHVEQEDILQVPRPSGVNDMRTLLDTTVSGQTAIFKQMPMDWFLCCVVLPLYVCSRANIYLGELFWACATVDRVWKAFRTLRRRLMWLEREVSEVAKAQLGLSEIQAEDLVHELGCSACFGFYFSLW